MEAATNERHPETTTPSTNRWSLVLWWIALAVWTFGLLSSDPPRLSAHVLPSEAAFPVAKATHVTVYAALSLWAALRFRCRWWLAVLLLAHGAATEFIQQYVPGRSGSWRDVGLDAAGITLGLAFGLAIRRWRA